MASSRSCRVPFTLHERPDKMSGQFEAHGRSQFLRLAMVTGPDLLPRLMLIGVRRAHHESKHGEADACWIEKSNDLCIYAFQLLIACL